MEPGGLYHIYNRGHNRDIIFYTEENYHFFMQLLKEHLLEALDIHAYCLMPNHYHLLVRCKDIPENEWKDGKRALSSRRLASFVNTYTKCINKAEQRVGALFQGRTKQKAITENDYYLRLLYYIHSNPVEAGLCEAMQDWRYSSFRSLISNQPTELCREEVLDWFGSVKAFRDYHRAMRDVSKIEEDIGF